MNRLIALLIFLPTFLLASVLPVSAAPTFLLPRTGLGPDDVALLINEDDPLSRSVGAHYQKMRHIPVTNVVRLRFPAGETTLTPEAFARLKQEVDERTPRHVQAFAVAWTAPYRVGCMSLTSALAFGFDDRFCSRNCGSTAVSTYFNAPGTYPMQAHGLRPAMMLAGRDDAAVRALIDRGIAADSSFPGGRAVLMSTTDRARNVRATHFEQTVEELGDVFPIEVLAADAITAREHVLFFFTGLAKVPGIETLRFAPGALADHLTSFGGQLTDSSQMSALRWLEAGATASYGTVTEPCNHPQKFPLPAVAMFFYAGGATAIEAYWKSVAWPGEGVFIGEPLSRPFAMQASERSPGVWELRFHAARAGRVHLEHALSPMGPFRPVSAPQPVVRGTNRVSLQTSVAGGFLRPAFVSR
jgi:uncharacterized protein (TIGR03790 family)